MKKLKLYPSWVCSDCGMQASNNRAFTCSTFHVGMCDVCDKEKSITEARDFFYPKFKGHKTWVKSTNPYQDI